VSRRISDIVSRHDAPPPPPVLRPSCPGRSVSSRRRAGSPPARGAAGERADGDDPGGPRAAGGERADALPGRRADGESGRDRPRALRGAHGLPRDRQFSGHPGGEQNLCGRRRMARLHLDRRDDLLRDIARRSGRSRHRHRGGPDGASADPGRRDRGGARRRAHRAARRRERTGEPAERRGGRRVVPGASVPQQRDRLGERRPPHHSRPDRRVLSRPLRAAERGARRGGRRAAGQADGADPQELRSDPSGLQNAAAARRRAAAARRAAGGPARRRR